MDALAAKADRRRQARAHDRRVVSGALRVGFLVLLAKICIAAREVAVAAYYGTSAVVDAYNIAFTIVTWAPIMLTAASVAALVPTLVRLRIEKTRYAAFVSELNLLALGMALLLLVATVLTGPMLARLVAGDAAAATKASAAMMTLEMAPFAGLLLLSGFYALRLQAEERFLYSFFEAMPALFVAFAAIAVGHAWGGTALVAGTLVGGLAQVLALAWMMRHLSTGFGGHRLPSSSPEWRVVASALVAMGIGQALINGSVPLDQFIATRSGEGGVAVLGYANRLIGITTSMGTVVLARALLPIISSTIAAGEGHLARAQTLRWALMILAMATAATAAGIALTPWGVALILQRGAFSAADAAAVSWVVQIGLVQLPFFLGGLVVVQWLAAKGCYRRIATIAGIALLVKVLILAMLPRSWGVQAVMISTVLMYAISFALQFGSLFDNKIAECARQAGIQS